MLKKIILIVLVSVLLTIVLSEIHNKSNFQRRYIIPFIVALILKYLFGDLDKGYRYTISDIFFWLTVLLVPYLTIIYLGK